MREVYEDVGAMGTPASFTPGRYQPTKTGDRNGWVRRLLPNAPPQVQRHQSKERAKRVPSIAPLSAAAHVRQRVPGTQSGVRSRVWSPRRVEHPHRRRRPDRAIRSEATGQLRLWYRAEAPEPEAARHAITRNIGGIVADHHTSRSEPSEREFGEGGSRLRGVAKPHRIGAQPVAGFQRMGPDQCGERGLRRLESRAAKRAFPRGVQDREGPGISVVERRSRSGETLREHRERRRLRLRPRNRRAQVCKARIDRIPNQWCVLRALAAEQKARRVDYRRERAS